MSEVIYTAEKYNLAATRLNLIITMKEDVSYEVARLANATKKRFLLVFKRSVWDAAEGTWFTPKWYAILEEYFDDVPWWMNNIHLRNGDRYKRYPEAKEVNVEYGIGALLELVLNDEKYVEMCNYLSNLLNELQDKEILSV